MLARKYSYETEEKIAPSTRELHFTELKKDVEKKRLNWGIVGFYTVLSLLILTYGISVAVGKIHQEMGSKLLSLQAQELQLVESNKILRLEVEQLKSPERVMGFAEKSLGLATARSNIYVYPNPSQKMNKTTYALTDK